MTTPVLSKPVKCGWGNTRLKHDKPAICEAQSITGKWTPCCKTCLARKQRVQNNNPYSALFPLNVKPLGTFTEHDLELIREGRAMSDFDTRRGE